MVSRLDISIIYSETTAWGIKIHLGIQSRSSTRVFIQMSTLLPGSAVSLGLLLCRAGEREPASCVPAGRKEMPLPGLWSEKTACPQVFPQTHLWGPFVISGEQRSLLIACNAECSLQCEELLRFLPPTSHYQECPRDSAYRQHQSGGKMRSHFNWWLGGGWLSACSFSYCLVATGSDAGRLQLCS